MSRSTALLLPVIAITILATSAATAASQPATKPAAATKIRTLLITGVNNHNWQFTSRVHEDTLEATGLFDVDVTEDPAASLADATSLAAYQLFVIDYNDYDAPKRWPPQAEQNFTTAVQTRGVGVVAIHSANNSFKGWGEYESMLGLLWREGAGHGEFHTFDVTFADADHPITKGLPTSFSQPDELYHGLTKAKDAPYKLLAQAMSSRASKGTGKDEPMAFTLQAGKGRIFATPLGHVWTGQAPTKQSVISPGFRTLLARGAEWAATGNVTLPSTWSDVRVHNKLSEKEVADGWTLLFDGVRPLGLRAFRGTAMPSEGWVIADGMLTHEAGRGGGDIATAEQYADFEFSCDWRAAPGANSGVIYRCAEDQDFPWRTGAEMQILDDVGHKDGKQANRSAGALYDLIGPSADVVRPANEWNTASMLIVGSRTQYFLNGVKVVDVDTKGDVYKAAYVKSKWPTMPTYGTTTTGHICLQDHGDLVSFRNLKVRRIK